MIEQQGRQRIVRTPSYVVAIRDAGELGRTAGAGAGDGRTLTTPAGRQAVPAGPFAVLRGSAVVEFDGDDSLVYLRSGMVCDFAPQAGASWVVAEPLTVQEVTRCPWHTEQRASRSRDASTGFAA